MTKAQKTVLYVLLAVGLVGALWSAADRVAVERANRTVALCIDELEVRQLALLCGTTPATLLADFRARGVSHVAVAEQSLGELLQRGLVEVRSEPEGSPLIVADDPALQGRLSRAAAKLPGGRTTLPADAAFMSNLGVGYPEAAVNAVRTAGLSLVARPYPDYLMSPPAVDTALQTAADTGARTVIFNGVSVAGGTHLARETAASLQRRGLQYGYIEMVPQEGEAALARALDYQVIRTHSISPEEMLKTSPVRGLDRFLLAVTERNVRLCYVRLMLKPQDDPLGANLAYLQSIADGLKAGGYLLGTPAPLDNVTVSRPQALMTGFGVVGGLLWLLTLVFRLSERRLWVLTVVFAAIAVVLLFSAGGLSRSLLALIGAIVFPTLGILLFGGGLFPPRSVPDDDDLRFGPTACPLVEAVPGKPPLLLALVLTVRITLVAALGGIIVAGLLSSSAYLLQVDQFRGVKLAHLAPLVIVLVIGVLWGTEAYRQSAGGEWAALRSGLREIADVIVRYRHLLALAIGLAAVALLLLRSGNAPGMEVPGFELQLRAFLNKVLLVRPRTKEILIGYPALVLGLWLLLQGKTRTAWLWLFLGAIGQVSVFNTFCHLHTPLMISIMRVVNGLWVGLLIGIGWCGVKVLAEKILRHIWWNDPECES